MDFFTRFDVTNDNQSKLFWHTTEGEDLITLLLSIVTLNIADKIYHAYRKDQVNRKLLAALISFDKIQFILKKCKK